MLAEIFYQTAMQYAISHLVHAKERIVPLMKELIIKITDKYEAAPTRTKVASVSAVCTTFTTFWLVVLFSAGL